MSSAGYHFGAPPSSSTTSTTSATEAGTGAGGLQSSLWLHLAAAAAAASQNHQHPTIPNISVKEPHRYHLQILSMTKPTPAAIKSSLKFNLVYISFYVYCKYFYDPFSPLRIFILHYKYSSINLIDALSSEIRASFILDKMM